MTLRARLTLFFIGIVVVPLVVAAFALRSFLAGDVERRTNTRLEASARAVSAVWLERLDGIREDVAEAARRLGTDLARKSTGKNPGAAGGASSTSWC